MAPVTATSVGIARQIIDDPLLVDLLRRLSIFDPSKQAPSPERNGLLLSHLESKSDDVSMGDECWAGHRDAISDASASCAGGAPKPPLDIDKLVAELNKCPRWRFQEQADLYEWIRPLNAMDAAITYFLRAYPSILLIPRSSKIYSSPETLSATHHLKNESAASVADTLSVPHRIIRSLVSILRFLSNLLRNATNKLVFNSVEEISCLLAAADDDVAALALEVLSNLAAPPLLHRQQAPEMHQHTTALHSLPLNSNVLWRLMMLAKGWGSKGSGLGLFACVTADDSSEGQGRLPKTAGEISFECYCQSTNAEASESVKAPASSSIVVNVSTEDMLVSCSTQEQEQQAEKRRKTEKAADERRSPAADGASRCVKTTAELFFYCLDKIEESGHSRNQLPPEKQFSLLSDVRLARSFHSCATREKAVEIRLRALTCILHSHSHQDTVQSYFLAQPELCSELVDLVKPTVSSTTLASTTLLDSEGDDTGVKSVKSDPKNNSILALADSPIVPYNIRTLAIESLTALVARRDPQGTMTNTARQVNVLGELGVGKGQYLGLLPTLIRYSLAALNSFLLHNRTMGLGSSEGILNEVSKDSSHNQCNEDIGLELGLIFLKATKSPSLSETDREEQALEFIDSVLTLTSAVVSVQSGTAALTDCGIIPALVSTIALDSQTATDTNNDQQSLLSTGNKIVNESYSDCLLKFITAQAIQILEGAIVTHTNALSAFHELHGVDILVQRLNMEVKTIQSCFNEMSSSSKMKNDDVEMEDADTASNSKSLNPKPGHTLQAARRVLLFSAVNCLTVVFHQHESGALGGTVASGGAQLRKPELLSVLIDIMDNVDIYGGVLAALVATFLSDVMNADPQVVHYVHKSGLAKSFFAMLLGQDNEAKSTFGEDVEKWGEPIMDPSAELIMALPNVISALSLTEHGAKVVSEMNPFPALLSVFCSPKYAMPYSRCLLNEMSAIVGTGLDEIMRHNPSLRTVILKAFIQLIHRVVFIGKNLIRREESKSDSSQCGALTQNLDDMETSRTLLMQYGYNVTQLLEQILHNEDHVIPFVDADGFDALLEFARWSIIPGGKQLVAHVSCLSSPSIASVTHSTTSNTLATAVKTIASHCDPHKLMKKVFPVLESQLFHVQGSMRNVRDQGGHTNETREKMTLDDSLSCENILEAVPCAPLHDLDESEMNTSLVINLSVFFRSLIYIEWLTHSIASILKAACQRSNDLGAGLGRSEREWKKEIESKSFETLISQLSLLHRSALWEVCRVRTEPGFDSRDVSRNRSCQSCVWRIRIVCQEGAIVRNGIDIDGCENVGNLEMGEIVEAFDRCINSSGVLRYQTTRGWVSEQTRGHGREHIAEVISVRSATNDRPFIACDEANKQLKRIECGVFDLRSVSASIMARLHGGQKNLFSGLERLMVSGIRSLPLRDRVLSFQQNRLSPHIVSVTQILSTNLKLDLEFAGRNNDLNGNPEDTTLSHANNAAKCMFYGSVILNLLHTALYEERRERRLLNIPLLLNLLASDGWTEGIYSSEEVENMSEQPTPETGVLSAIKFVLQHSLHDVATFAAKEKPPSNDSASVQCVSRAVAASLPPTLSFLRRLISRPLFVESQMNNVLAKMKSSDMVSLISNQSQRSEETLSFNVHRFTRALHLQVAEITFETWSDKRFCYAPAHILHPFIGFMGELVSSLEEAGKVYIPADSARDQAGTSRSRSVLNDFSDRRSQYLNSMSVLLGRSSARAMDRPSEPFEPSETSIARLIEMGFNRDHALEALETTGTNRVEVAMEYALTHPPSSPATLERRRAARERRRQEQERRSALENTVQERSTNDAEGETPASQNQTLHETSPNSDIQSPNISQNNGGTNLDDEAKSTTNEQNTLTESEIKAQKQRKEEEKSADRSRHFLDTVKESLTAVSLNIIERNGQDVSSIEEPAMVESKGHVEDGGSTADGGDSGAVVVVVCNFLVELSSRYPADMSKISSELLRRLKSNLHVKSPSHCRVKLGCESNFAALAHASVVFFRAIPKARPSILRHGIVGCLLHCVRNVTLMSALRNGKVLVEEQISYPCWLTPALLLLELMATPTTVSLEEVDKDEEEGVSKSKKGEFGRVQSEHKKQGMLMAKATKQVFSAVSKEGITSSSRKKKVKELEAKKASDKNAQAGSEEKTCDLAQEKQKQGTQFMLPQFLPMILPETAQNCMLLCLQLLGLRSKKVNDKENLPKVCPPPGVVHAVLALLLRVLYSQKIAAQCLSMGGADLILSIPGDCRFKGNSGLVTLLLRRMLEDEATLVTMMETEIRSQVSKIWKKQQRSSSSGSAQPKVNLKPFMHAVTPLICRDAMVFLKAFASSVKLESAPSELSSHEPSIVLLSSEERTKNAKLLSAIVVSAHVSAVATPNNKKQSSEEEEEKKRGRSSQREKSPFSKSWKSKSPHRQSTSKHGVSPKSTPQSKKDKADGHHKKHTQIDGTPANHVTSLLLKQVVLSTPKDASSWLLPHEQPFLSTPDHLDILSDLVLAIPACAAAIHRFKLSNVFEQKSKHFSFTLNNALLGCSEPPQTAVSLLLHNLIPQPRSEVQPTAIEVEDTVNAEQDKKLSFMKSRMSQSAARLIVCLVARSGEGRRRVISDLSFALSCGQCPGTSFADRSAFLQKTGYGPSREVFEMWALKSWGELCFGLCSPKSSKANQDSNAALSFEVVRIMLENGVAHSLMSAIEKINLHHPMASEVACSLVRPLEIFTRASVFITVKELIEKDKAKEKVEDLPKSNTGSRRTTFGPSQRSESAFADDAMLEDGFDAETAENSALRNASSNYGDIVIGSDSEEGHDVDEEDNSLDESMEEVSSDSDDDESSEEDEIEVRLGNVDYSDDDEIDSDDDEEISSNSSESASSEDGDSDAEGSDEDMDDDDADDAAPAEDEEELFLEGSEDDVLEEEEGWDRENDDFFEGNAAADNNDVEGGIGDSEGDEGMEGWTAINPHLGNAFPPGLGLGLVGGHRHRQNNGGLVEAAESLLGNILRSSEMESLSEIEDSLGIRIVQNRRDGRGSVGILMNRPLGGDRTSTSTGPSHSAVPVNQLTPDAGYSLAGASGSIAESNPMEFMFGGPAFATHSMGYDLTANLRDQSRNQEPIPSTFDTHLFPGGPAASTHSRTQQSAHPLLNNVELPPVNALVSTLSSRGTRSSTQPDRMSRLIATSGTYVSGPNGNVIRVNGHPHYNNGEPPNRPTARNTSAGWTDDGLRIDRTTEEFSLSFGQALNTGYSQHMLQVRNSHTDANGSSDHDTAMVDNQSGSPSENNELLPSQSFPPLETDGNADSEEAESRNQNVESQNLGEEEHSNIAEASGTQVLGTDDNEQNVATSLASGLTISQPTSEDVLQPEVDDSTPNESLPAEDGGSARDNSEQLNNEVVNQEPDDPSGVLNESQNIAEPSQNETLHVEPAQSNCTEEGNSTLSCPPNIDVEVFNSLPFEMQQEIVAEHQATTDVAAQLGETSGLDPEALAALPEEMRNEIIQQEQEQQRIREQPAADPANAEDMDNASFLASLAPDLREEILLQADDDFLNSLPENIVAEAQILRERAASQHRRRVEETTNTTNVLGLGGASSRQGSHALNVPNEGHATNSSRGRRQRNGKIRVEMNRENVVYIPASMEKSLGPLLTRRSTKALVRLLFLLTPVQPQKYVHKLFLNMCLHAQTREIFLESFTSLLNGDISGVTKIVEKMGVSTKSEFSDAEASHSDDEFPPCTLIGTVPDVFEARNTNSNLYRRRLGLRSNSAAAVASSLPQSARGSCNEKSPPPVVARRIISLMAALSKASPRICIHMLSNSRELRGADENTGHIHSTICFERIVDLLEKDLYAKSATNLEQLLSLLETVAAPLSLLPKDNEQEIDLTSERPSPHKEFVKVPQVALSKKRLHLLCSVLRLESCKESSFVKVNTLTRRLSRVEANRDCILSELAFVAQSLGADAKRDLKSVSVRLSAAVTLHQEKINCSPSKEESSNEAPGSTGTPSSAVCLSTSSSELKLLRVLQTLHTLCGEFSHDGSTKSLDCNSPEFVSLSRTLNLETLWDQLSLCLRTVSVLEGVANVDLEDNDESDENDSEGVQEDGDLLNGKGGKKLQNSVAGLITRFLPAIEAFFMVNSTVAAQNADASSKENGSLDQKDDSSRLVQFVASNKILINALLRSNPHLLEKGLRAMVQVPRCRPFLDFDVKRQWFKSQVRRLRQQASRRHGSLRLNLRRKRVFEDAFHAFIHRNAEELRGRLHITFQNEEGVDAGGLSREFFAILAKEMFNPNYALFMSTEDGCTFQPNPNSSINPEDLRYFRFVGRIVGKAVVDGFLLDAHFTRSLYKHMLGIKPTHHDMQAIDPDYYKNLQLILEHNLTDIGLELTFSTEDHSFGRSQTLDLIPNGRNIPVTEETKSQYVDLVCEHRMTTAIEKQIEAYLEGFHELVDRDLISIFTAKELELLISGMPDIDVHDLKKNTEYNGYRPADKEICWFWNIMFSLSRSEKAAFLQFVTGSSKVPLAGFSELQGMRGVQKFSINKASGPSGALMSAHTCFNALDLPVYSSEEEMKEKLLYAISEGGGGFLFA